MALKVEASLLMWGFEKVGLLVWGCSYHFCLNKDRAQKCSWEIGNFSISLPRGINQGQFWNVIVLWLVFGWWKGFFGRLEALASLDAYQITNYQFLSKLIIFRCLIFEEFNKKVSKSGVSWPIAWKGVIKWFIRFFQNHAPWGTTHFFYPNDSIVKEIVY